MDKSKKIFEKQRGNENQKSTGSSQDDNVKKEATFTVKTPKQEKVGVKDVSLEGSLKTKEYCETLKLRDINKSFQYSVKIENQEITKENKMLCKEQENWDEDQEATNNSKNAVKNGEIASGSTCKPKDDCLTQGSNFRDQFRNYEKISNDEFDNFEKLLKGKKKFQYEKVVEIEADLFNIPNDVSLAHCVAQDLNMGSGIAVTFSSKFQRHGELAEQRQKPGGMAVLDFKTQFIYYLVTKKYSNGKPTMQTLWKSLKKMQMHVTENGVKNIAIPRIGCGLDRLKWEQVKPMIEHVFRDTDVKITVCNLLQPSVSTSSPQIFKKPRIVTVSYPITDIESGTMVIYFGSEDGVVTPKIEELDQKFHMRLNYIQGRKKVGEVVETNVQNWSYLLFGCIIKKTAKGPVDNVGVHRCAQEINKINQKHGKEAYIYLGIEVFNDPPNDEMLFQKILNIFKNTVQEVEIYVCYPKDMLPLKRSRNYFF